MEGQKEQEDIKESFCPICIAAIPLAFSVSTGVAAATEEEQNIMTQKRNKIMLWSSIIGFISLAVILYYWFIKKCTECD